MRSGILLAAVVALMLPPIAHGDDPGKPIVPEATFESGEIEAIEAVVKRYILEHPEILIEALRSLEEKERVARAAAQRRFVEANLNALTRDPGSPVLGNPDGDITIVEFSDYRCPYCRRVSGDLIETIDKDGKIRLVLKEFPILGADSVVAARAALAADRQGRYREFHLALMTMPGEINEHSVLAVAGDLGLDIDRLRADMASPEIEEQISRTNALAQGLQINGTPAFIVGTEIVPGALSMRQLMEIVDQERAKTG